MNGYDQQLKELLAQCARKRKLEASAAELRRQRDTYAARAEELTDPSFSGGVTSTMSRTPAI